MILLIMLLLQLGQTNACSSLENVYFSEYIEGSSHNKALEIYNGSNQTLDLSCLRVEMYFNGASEPEFQVDLIGTLPSQEVFVLWHEEGKKLAPYASNLTYQQSSGFGWFNGDDSILLMNGAQVIDRFGTVGVRPDGMWSREVRTKDRTLRRNPEITQGDISSVEPFNPAEQWLEFEKDTFDGLGSR